MVYLVAVSGGIDSVVLLHMLVQEGEHDLTVAHFDHGIRDDSAADARFVEELAAQYGLPYVGKREELGKIKPFILISLYAKLFVYKYLVLPNGIFWLT